MQLFKHLWGTQPLKTDVFIRSSTGKSFSLSYKLYQKEGPEALQSVTKSFVNVTAKNAAPHGSSLALQLNTPSTPVWSSGYTTT